MVYLLANVNTKAVSANLLSPSSLCLRRREPLWTGVFGISALISND